MTTLNTPSWPTRTRPGLVGRRPDARVARRPADGRRCRAGSRDPGARARDRSAGRTRACDLGQGLAAGRQDSPGTTPPGRELRRPATARSRPVSRPPTRPGRSRGARLGRARATGARRGSGARAIASATAVAVRGRARQRRVDDLHGRPAGIGRAGEACGRASRSPARAGLAAAALGQRGLRLALEPALADPLRLAVAEQDQRGVEAVRDDRRAAGRRPGLRAVAHRSPPRRMDQASITRVVAADRVHDGVGDVVVEREDHERVLARRRPGERHRS